MRNQELIETTQVTNSSIPASVVREFVAFGLGEEEYAVDIGKVREIRSFTASTPMPEAPAYVLGVVNLRGSVVPIMDLRERFGQVPVEPDRQTVVVILEFADRTVGLVVDAVSDILRLDVKNIQPAPDYAENPGAGCVEALIVEGERLIGILSLDHVLGDLLNSTPIEAAA